MQNDKETITIRVGKPITFYAVMGLACIFLLLGFVFSKMKITKYHPLDEDRNTQYKSVYIEITELPVELKMGGDEHFYMARNDKSVFIFELKEKQYDEIKAVYEQDGENFRYRIEGETRSIYKHMEEVSLRAYNDYAGSKMITDDNYEEYFGGTYIDATEDNAGTVISFVCYMLAFLVMFIALIALIDYFHRANRIRKTISEYGREELERQINAPTSVTYPKAGICLADKYIISSAMGFDVIRYDEIVWLYILKRRLNFVTVTQVVTAATVNGKLISIAAAYDEKLLKEVIVGIHAKHPAVMVGYTPENRRKWTTYLGHRR